jgi:hypothetical protein
VANAEEIAKIVKNLRFPIDTGRLSAKLKGICYGVNGQMTTGRRRDFRLSAFPVFAAFPISAFPVSLQHSNTPTLQHSNTPTPQHPPMKVNEG